MDDKEVIRLVTNITEGKISKTAALRRLRRIEKKKGFENMMYEVDDRYDKDYLHELISDYKIGIYSRESIERMIKIKDSNGELPRFSYTMVVAIVFCVLVVISITSFLLMEGR